MPIDSDVQCIARVRGLPAIHTSMMTNGGASMPICCQPDTWWLYPQHVCVISAPFSERVRATSALRARGKRASAELYATPNLS